MPRRRFIPSSTPTTTTANLRANDPDRTRAEIRAFQERIGALVEKDPRKATVVLSDWISRSAAQAAKKKKAA